MDKPTYNRFLTASLSVMALAVKVGVLIYWTLSSSSSSLFNPLQSSTVQRVAECKLKIVSSTAYVAVQNHQPPTTAFSTEYNERFISRLITLIAPRLTVWHRQNLLTWQIRP